LSLTKTPKTGTRPAWADGVTRRGDEAAAGAAAAGAADAPGGCGATTSPIRTGNRRGPPVARGRVEAAGDRMTAMAAPAVGEVEAAQRVRIPLDHEAAAGRAVRALPRPVVDVARVDVVQSERLRDVLADHERLGRRGRPVPHAEVGMKGREVEANIGAEVRRERFAHPPDLVVIVVLAGDHEVRALEPDLGLVLQPAKGVEHRLELREGEVAVEAIGESLEVHVRGVLLPEERPAGLGRDVAGRHGHAPHRRGAAGPGGRAP